MTLLHPLLCLGCLAVVVTPFGQAQQSSEEASTANASPGGWLGKEDPKAVAWRAYNAMVSHDESATPELVSLGSQWQPLSPQAPSDNGRWRLLSAEQEEERDAMTAVLDALIQLKAPVPGSALRSLAADFDNAAAIILARMPIEDSGPLSMEFYGSPVKQGFSLQYVSAALLAFHPRPGVAGKLLGDITVRAKVYVVVPGGPGMGSGTFGDCVNSSEPERDGWPKMGQYKLSTQLSEGATVLVGGAEPIYVSREESTHYLGNDCGGWRGLYLGREQRRAFIAEMLGVAPETIPWETDIQEDIEFRAMEQFTGSLLGFIEDQQQLYRATAKELEERGLLTASEIAQSLPQIELDLTDARCVGSDDEDSDDDKDSHERCEHDIEPISKDAIKLPARVVWARDDL